MRITRLYLNTKLNIHQILELDAELSHKLLNVLRLKKDDKLIVFNGEQDEYLSEIQSIHRKIVGLKILLRIVKNVESPLKIHLGQVMAKGDKMDFVVQKATELGVHRITPLSSERSVVHLKHERIEKKIEHWQKVVIHAAEQSGRTFVPQIEKPMDINEWVHDVSESTRLVLDPTGEYTLSAMEKLDSVALLIGPEGGLSPEEISFALKKGFKGVQFGPRILRTETAALAAIAALQCRAGDMCTPFG